MRKCLNISTLVLAIFILVGACSDKAPTVAEEEPEDLSDHTEPPAQTMGINVNGQFGPMSFDNVDRSETTWVRGFIDFFQLYPEEENLDSSENITKYNELKEQGYQTILSIKWDFSNKSFPDPEGDEIEDYKSYLDEFLQKVWNQTDIIVVGNEPYIESQQDEQGEELLDFYREIAHEVNNFKESRDREVSIYVGAFNNLYLEGWQTESVSDFLYFAENTSWIAGVDLHVHHSAIEQLTDAMDYVHSRIRDNQKNLITEFSVMKHWRGKIQETIPEEFGERYSWDSETENYEYLDYALKEQVPREEWVNFLSSSYWFENKKTIFGMPTSGLSTMINFI